jgi:hypothetical protein
VLDLKADGKPLGADAPPAVKLAAAEAIPVEEKLTAYQGAVNAALTRLGVDTAALPGQPGATINVAEHGLLARIAATTDPTEKAKLRHENMAAIRAGFRPFGNTTTK